MDLINISILTGLFIILLTNAVYEVIKGNRGKRNYITCLYSSLKSEKPDRKIEIKKSYGISERIYKKYIYYTVPVCILIFLISLIAFKSLGMSILLSIFGLIFPKILNDRAVKRKREIINSQLRDALNSITSSLKAGLSINSALSKCADELEKIFAGQMEKPMYDEFLKVKNELILGLPVNDVLVNFKNRVGTEDVDDFANSIIIVRQKGGNLVDVVENVSKMITDKLEVKREINRLTASKKSEAKILSFLPVFIIVALSIFSPKYMQPLYSSLLGKIVIIIGFIMLIMNYYIGKRIVDIKV